MNSHLNMKWYNPNHKYSDGAIEQEIYNNLMQGCSEADLLQKDDRWPILYHFSPVRQNIVRFLQLPKSSEVLEIGSGMGAITKALCQKAGHVTSVDLSLLRSQINEKRNEEADNLEIIVANLNDIPFDRQFDLVTLIGVLEYGGKYTNGEDPYLDFFLKAYSLVKPGGELVIAIENRMGLKYFAGANEDHYGVPFYGLNGYPEDQGIRTFSLPELKKLLEDAGCSDYDLYLPLPDYKFATSIVAADAPDFFESALADECNFGAYSMNTFDQRKVFSSLIAQGTFVEFANSFLISVHRPQ